MSEGPVLALVGTLVGLLAGFGPRVIALLPEPEPADPESDTGSRLTIAPATDKVPYAVLARRPHLALGLAVLGVAAGVLLALRLEWTTDLLVVLPLVPLGVWLAWVDARTTYLPTRLIAPAYGLVVVAVLIGALLDEDWTDARRAVFGWVVYGGSFLVMWLITPGFGYGDVRLAGVLGLALGYVGWPALLLGFLGGLLLGALLGGLLALSKVIDPRRNPFGPYMLGAALVAATFGPQLADALGY